MGALLNESMGGDVELSHDELIGGGGSRGQEDDKQSNTIMQQINNFSK